MMNENSKDYMKKTEETDKEPKVEHTDSELKKIPIEKPIVITAEVYKTIILYASRYANQAIPPAEWKEIYGILIGYSTDDVVYIIRAEALTFGHSTDVQLDERHYIFIDEIQQKLDQEGKGYYIIGWFHSHPGLGLFFSDIDIINQLGFQANNKDFCGLVFDHTLLGKKKQEKMEGSQYTITKYDTGFEIYRLNDVNIDINDPEFENNYHKVDYVIDGLNKFFFANVLTELSALATSGKPLQSAYKEEISGYTPQFTFYSKKPTGKLEEESANNHERALRQGVPELSEIPQNNKLEIEIQDLFDDKVDISRLNKDEKFEKLKSADKLIFEGNQAFKNNNSVEGVEKYRKALNIFTVMNEDDKAMEYLSKLVETCTLAEHYTLAEQFSTELFKIAEENGSLFYMGGAKFIIGFINLFNNNIKISLENLQQAAILYEKSIDYYGTGLCNQKIGSIYNIHFKDYDSESLFFLEAMKNFNNALYKTHPLRKTILSTPKYINERINNLRKHIESNLNIIKDQAVKSKIENDLVNFEYKS